MWKARRNMSNKSDPRKLETYLDQDGKVRVRLVPIEAAKKEGA